MQLLETLSNFFISSAHAAGTIGGSADQAQQGNLSFFIMMAVLISFMYFLIWRPQQKRAKEQRDLIGSLSKGDEVVTSGGFLGTISKISDSYVVLTLTDNVDVTMQKSSIVAALPKGTLKSI